MSREGDQYVPLLPGRQQGGGPHGSDRYYAAGPLPEVAPNRERLGFARVALIARDEASVSKHRACKALLRDVGRSAYRVERRYRLHPSQEK